MPLPLLLDSNILARVLRSDLDENKPVAAAIFRLQCHPEFLVSVPEIADYELRRKLIHLGYQRHHARKWARDALSNLDDLVSSGYAPLTTETMRLAAGIWAQTRSQGLLRGSEDSLDVDCILAVQARQLGGQILTTNEKHFRPIADVFDWKPFLIAE